LLNFTLELKGLDCHGVFQRLAMTLREWVKTKFAKFHFKISTSRLPRLLRKLAMTEWRVWIATTISCLVMTIERVDGVFNAMQ